MEKNIYKIGKELFITSEEEIKAKDWIISKSTGELIKSSKSYCANNEYGKKIILTTDQDLIKDGVQAIDDEFLEWFVKNSSCEEIEIRYKEGIYDLSMGYPSIYKIIIPKEEPKQERMYSEEDLISFAHFYFQEEFNSTMQTSKSTDEILQEWKQFKKK